MFILQLPGIEGFEVRSGTLKIETNAGNTGPLRISRVNELHARTGDLVSKDKLNLGNQGSLELAFILNLEGENQRLSADRIQVNPDSTGEVSLDTRGDY